MKCRHSNDRSMRYERNNCLAHFVKLNRNIVTAYVLFGRCVSSIQFEFGIFILSPVQCLREWFIMNKHSEMKQPKMLATVVGIQPEYIYFWHTHKCKPTEKERWLNRIYECERGITKTMKIEGSIRPCNANTWYKIAPLNLALCMSV